MKIRRTRSGLFGALAAILATVAMLVLVPSAVLAHSGHKHANAQADAKVDSKVDTKRSAQPDVASRAKAPVAQDLTSRSHANQAGDESPCDGRGCCTSGNCAGCHGFVLVTLPAPLPPLVSTVLSGDSAAPRASPDQGRLRRPPKSFA